MVFLTEPAHDGAKRSMVLPEADADWPAKSSVAMAWQPAYIQPAFSVGLNEAAP